MNGHGGFHACRNNVTYAREEMQTGAKRVRLGCNPKEYKGTLLYHRIGMYSAIISNAKGITAQLDKEELPTHEEVIRAYDFISHANHVKCSADNGKRSEPTLQMWENCGSFILKEELVMLEPEILLVLGTSNNQHWLENNVLDKGSLRVLSNLGKVQIKEARFKGREIKVVFVPHPAAGNGGCAKQIMFDLKQSI